MHHRRPYNDTAVAAVLPGPSALLRALAGQNASPARRNDAPARRAHAHDGAERRRGGVISQALCGLARELTEVHRQMGVHPKLVDELGSRRVVLIADIDAWTIRNLPSPAVGARPHEHTLGETIDGMAAVAAHAFLLLATDGPTSDRVHRQWTRLAELEVAYGDLARDLRDGRRYLPVVRAHGTDQQVVTAHGPNNYRTIPKSPVAVDYP